jgi:hypothetical protein
MGQRETKNPLKTLWERNQCHKNNGVATWEPRRPLKCWGVTLKTPISSNSKTPVLEATKTLGLRNRLKTLDLEPKDLRARL